jgi:flagellar biosynthetic protein FliR
MNPVVADVMAQVPAFALVLARVAGAAALLPGLGEAAAPAAAKIGIAVGVTVLLLPAQPLLPGDIADSGVRFGLMVASEAATGLWFGWLVRMFALSLATGAQFIAYLVGLSSVLQPDAELGSQSSAMGKLFGMAAPAAILASGLYRLPLSALDGFFRLVPLGHVLPVGDSVGMTVAAVADAFNLALQVAAPFVVAGIAWHVAMGLLARAGARMQVYFASMPGQILTGLGLLIVTLDAIVSAWRNGLTAFLSSFPGAG